MRPHGQTKLGFFPLPLKNRSLRHLVVRCLLFRISRVSRDEGIEIR
jgi:hypothetical protein